MSKMETSRAMKWDTMYNKVLIFVQANKHVRIPTKSSIELRKMNEWWHGQLKRKTLDTNQRDKINAVHGLIDPDERGKRTQHGEAWHRMYLKLQEQQQQNGSLFAHSTNNKELFNWVVEQRRLAKQRKLDPERKVKLQDLGLVLCVYNQKIRFEKQPRWIHTGKGGDHMAFVGCAPKTKVERKKNGNHRKESC
jgi:hypothetical protein